jgi:DNA-directed RNA polymerase
LRWLKIHLANLTGFDKASFDEREAYAMQHIEDVMDSADKPLEVSASQRVRFSHPLTSTLGPRVPGGG